MTPNQEKSLLDQIRSDPKKFGDLFDYYYRPIFSYICRRTLDFNLSKDIAAETFLKAFLKISDFKWNGIPVSAWLYRIATNEINQYFRRKKYQPITFHNLHDFEKHVLETTAEVHADFERELKLHQEFLLIQEKLKQLDLKYQEVISLRYFEHKDNKQIADILGKPEGTIKSLLSRGIEKLRTLMIQ